MTLEQYYKDCLLFFIENPGIILGHAMFNRLYQIRPDLTDRICLTELDPMFDNSKIPEFLKFVEENWK